MGSAAQPAAPPLAEMAMDAGVTDAGVPAAFLCPITTFIMTDPVIAMDSMTCAPHPRRRHPRRHTLRNLSRPPLRP